jgi:hypothetical protein
LLAMMGVSLVEPSCVVSLVVVFVVLGVVVVIRVSSVSWVWVGLGMLNVFCVMTLSFILFDYCIAVVC